jgi:hypothetical protein
VRIAGNLRKARGTNKGHVLLLNSGGNLLFDEIDQPLLNSSLRFEAQITIPDPIVVPGWFLAILQSERLNGLAQAWPRSSFSADSPEEAATSKAASRRNSASLGRVADVRFGRKRTEKDETSTHDSYS